MWERRVKNFHGPFATGVVRTVPAYEVWDSQTIASKQSEDSPCRLIHDMKT